MKNAWILRAMVAFALVAAGYYFASKTTWEDEWVDEPLRGAAADDPWYSARALLKGRGQALKVTQGLEPLPPTSATLVLDSTFWDVFPERAPRLEAWVRSGGHLVVTAYQLGAEGSLNWVPMLMHAPRWNAASAPASAARPIAKRPRPPVGLRIDSLDRERKCDRVFHETPGSRPAYEPGRQFTACLFTGPLKAARAVVPTWEMVDKDGAPLAMRVPVGRGEVTATTAWIQALLDNRGLLRADAAIVAMAVLQPEPGRAVWIVEDDDTEPLPQWLWHHARAPLLAALATVALALWRAMVRFGPRAADPPAARRSMGEQVRGTGAFIAALEPAALHAATRRAFEQAVRLRVHVDDSHTDRERLQALAGNLASAATLDIDALLAALNPAPRAPAATWIAAIETLESARRSLLRAPTRNTP